MSDLSQLSDDELRQMYENHPEYGRAQQSQPLENQPQDADDWKHGNLLKRGLYSYGQYAKGVGKGAAQFLGDAGASIGNLGISGLEHATDHNIPHIPHPSLLSGTPSGLAESIGQKVGQYGTGFAIPGASALKGASLIGERAPLLAKLLAGSATGTATGYATNEGNRGLGALIGGVAGSLGVGVPAAQKLASSIKSTNIAKNVIGKLNELKAHYGEKFNSAINEAEAAGANKFIRPEVANAKLLKGKDSDLIYALEKHNNNPSIRTAHEAQRDLSKYIMRRTGEEGQKSADAAKEALRLKNRLLVGINNAMQKSKAPHTAEQFSQARTGYGRDVGPYLDSKAIDRLESGNLRSKNFADKLLEEESFLTKAAHNHPDLLTREKWNAIKHNKFAWGLGSGIAASVLPHQISKYLGIK